MSEFINNVSKRKEILKNILRQLHEGKPMDEVHKLCDVHVAVMRGALERRSQTGSSPDTIPGLPLHTFKLENGC